MRPLVLAIASAILLASAACSRVPITGRKQAKLLPESRMVQMSLAAYGDFLAENDVVEAGSDHAMLQRVGQRIAASVEEVMRHEGGADRLELVKWEFNLVEDDLVNAWAMPGGKVVVYTGILPITKNETGLAVVLSHELAHAIAWHGNERMSQLLLAELGLSATAVALDAAMEDKPEETKALLYTAAGVGVQLGVLLPYSRKHESEADELGLIFMANAGYDPSEAVAFWTRMHKLSGDPLPEFLSTHPSHETRIHDIQTDFLPQAMTYYRVREK